MRLKNDYLKIGDKKVMKKPIFFGADHAGKDLKDQIIYSLKKEKGFINWEIIDLTPNEESINYPLVANDVSLNVMKQDSFGILICGTGLGMCMTANKTPAIRAVTCNDTYSAGMSRAHNDANILCLGSRVVGNGLALTIVLSFILTPFEGGRHLARVNMIREIENDMFTK